MPRPVAMLRETASPIQNVFGCPSGDQGFQASIEISDALLDFGEIALQDFEVFVGHR